MPEKMNQSSSTNESRDNIKKSSFSYVNSSESGQYYCNKQNPFAEFLFRFNAYKNLFLQLKRKNIPIKEIIQYRYPLYFKKYNKPTLVSIELSSLCNLRCKYCLNSLTDFKKGFMEPEVFNRLVDDLREMKISRAHIVGNGEQTLHPNFAVFMEKLAGAVKYIDIVTNGQWTNNDVVDTLIKNKIDRIDISIDVGGSEHYESTRTGANYDRLLNNLKYLKERKKQYNKRALIIIRLMLKPSKQAFLKDEIKYWKKYCDAVMVAPLCKFSHQDQLLDYGNDIYILNSDKDKFPKCYFPFNELFFLRSGDAVLCQILAYKKNKEELFLGNILNNSLSEIWNNPLMEGLREGQKNRVVEKMSFCKGCSTC